MIRTNWAIIGFVWVMNSYTAFNAQQERVGKGIAVPVLILIAVVLAMSFVATRTRFGRYVFAMGGNPDAALLSGIPGGRQPAHRTARGPELHPVLATGT